MEKRIRVVAAAVMAIVMLALAHPGGSGAATLAAQDVIQPPPWCPNTNTLPCAYTTVKVCIEYGWKVKFYPWGFEFERPCTSWREQQYTFYYGITEEEEGGILYPV